MDKTNLLTKELLQRSVSAVILAPLVLLILWAGGTMFSILVAMASIVMSFEWADITSKNTPEGDLSPDEKVRWRIYGFLYIAVFVSSVLYLRSLDRGFGLLLFVLIVIWTTDIAAYFCGRIIGGPKILPPVSPNKTWAGLIGGMLFAGIVSCIMFTFIGSASIYVMFILGMFLAFIGQVGDFFESWVKRKFSVKDSGNIIPGHGGLLDRVDALVVAIPAFVLIITIFNVV